MSTAKVRIGDLVELTPEDGGYGFQSYVEEIHRENGNADALVRLRPTWGGPDDFDLVRGVVTRGGDVVLEHAQVVQRAAAC